MSELKIALVAEGLTDLVIIEAALKTILPRPFNLTLLQPEQTQPKHGGGWCGVFRWCKEEIRAQGNLSLDGNPKLNGFHLVILHLDADVADKSYSDCGAMVDQDAQQAGVASLPCSAPCPPTSDAVDNLKIVLLSWLGVADTGSKSVFCIPSKSSEAWLAAAVFPEDANLLRELECNQSMETQLANLPKVKRIRKSQREYKRHAYSISKNWNTIRQICSQAEVFHNDVDRITQRMTL